MAGKTSFVDGTMAGNTLSFDGNEKWKPGERSSLNIIEIWNEKTAKQIAIGESNLVVVEDDNGNTTGVIINGLNITENSASDKYTAVFAIGEPDQELILKYKGIMASFSQQEGQASALGRGGATFINQGDNVVSGPFFNVVCVSNNVQFSQETTMQAGDPPPSNIAFIAGFSFMLPFSQIKLLRGTIMAYNG
jgi:hypothetical protein